MSERKATKYNAIVGITKEGAVVVLNEIFEYDHDFKGAIGTEFEIYNYNDIDTINDMIYEEHPLFLKYLWKDEVAADICECSFRQWLKERRAELDMHELIEGQDDSYEHRFSESFRQLSDENKKKLVEAINTMDRADYRLSSIFTKFKDVKDFERYFTTNVISEGRMFSCPDKIDWEVIINPDLIAIYETAEKQD